jgi:hypothetical protein
MRNEPQSQAKEVILTGTHGEYLWLTSSYDHYSGTLVKLCPEIFIGRYLAVTAIDSGIPSLTDKQKTAGWEQRREILYSPLLGSVEDVFYQRDGHEVPGFDEWYFFQASPELGELQKGNPFEEATAARPGRSKVFVGMPSATVHDTDPQCEFIRRMFWNQIGWIQPESYVADSSDCLTFVTKNRDLFELVSDKLTKSCAV